MEPQPEKPPVEKPYRRVPIEECGEPMAPIPLGRFAFTDPHPYVAAGAPYKGRSPWFLRKSVLAALENAQTKLDSLRPGWKIKLHDAFRPNEVQAYMVELEYKLVAKREGLDPENLTPEIREKLAPAVYRIWAIPSTDPQTPPLHSTGAAFDCTIQNENGNALFMGSPIDENSPRSNPDHYANDPMPEGRMAHENRMFLINLMKAEGFCHHPEEWWHFSIGDQLWAWLERQKHGTDAVRAVYGSAEELLKNAPNL